MLARVGLTSIYGIIIGSYLWVKKSHDNDYSAIDEYCLGDSPVIAFRDLTGKPAAISGTDEWEGKGGGAAETPVVVSKPEIQKDPKEETLRHRYNFINKVVNHCAPAVFYLEIRDPYKKDLETGESVITSNGSGFIISEDGWALTNAHVVLNKPQSTITAVMRDGRSFRAYVEDVDMNLDLALLKLESLEKLPSLQFAPPGDAAIGEWVVALGSPLSLSNSVTVGIVSCVDRPAEELGLKNYSMTYIQTDASITFGNSGGPLVNLDGQVIGINNLRLTSGISFAIPVEYANKFLEHSRYRIKNGKHKGPLGKTLFGITTISLSAEVLADLLRDNVNIPTDIENGLLVWKIVGDSAAAQSGLQTGDIITHVNGVPAKEVSDIYLQSNADDVLEVSVVQKGQKKKIIIDPKNITDENS
nr:unnamed protein product [Callosobruchus analis]